MQIFPGDFPFSDGSNYADFSGECERHTCFFKLVARNGFTRFVWEVFAREKFLSGKFWVFAPLHNGNHHFQEEDFWRGKINKTLKASFLDYCVPQLAQKVAVGWPGLACDDNSAKRNHVFALIFVFWSICICIPQCLYFVQQLAEEVEDNFRMTTLPKGTNSMQLSGRINQLFPPSTLTIFPPTSSFPS